MREVSPGEKFTRLTTIKRTLIGGRVAWKCRCDCGKIVTRRQSELTRESKSTKSCGCLRREGPHRTHGLSKTHPLYRKWSSMKNRCSAGPLSKFRSYYFNKITVCDEWLHDFKAFYEWAVSHGWKKGLEIHRKNNYDNYCPKNCVFLTPEDHKEAHKQLRKKPFKKKYLTKDQAGTPF